MIEFQLPLDDVQFLMEALRKISIKWDGRAECLRNARKLVGEGKHKNGKSKKKYHWQCNKCRRWARNENEMEVDHIFEIGAFKGDWNEFLCRHFPRPVDKFLQALCRSCHLKKTNAYNAANTKWKRKKEDEN